MYEFWYDYIKPKYQDKAKLCYMDTDSFIIHIETEDFYKDIADDIDKQYDTSEYDKDDKKALPLGINKKVLSMFKDELKGKIMIEFIALRAKGIQTFHKITAYPYGMNLFMVCKSEMLVKIKGAPIILLIKYK